MWFGTPFRLHLSTALLVGSCAHLMEILSTGGLGNVGWWAQISLFGLKKVKDHSRAAKALLAQCY